jgi:hypothetical protein
MSHEAYYVNLGWLQARGPGDLSRDFPGVAGVVVSLSARGPVKAPTQQDDAFVNVTNAVGLLRPSADFIMTVENTGTRDHVMNAGAVYR